MQIKSGSFYVKWLNKNKTKQTKKDPKQQQKSLHIDQATWVLVHSRCHQVTSQEQSSYYVTSNWRFFFNAQFSHWKSSACSYLGHVKDMIWRTSELSADTKAVHFALLSQPLPCSISRARSKHPYLSNKSCQDSGPEQQAVSSAIFEIFLMSLNTVSRKLWIIYIKRNFETNYQKGLITLDPQLSLTMNDYKNSAVFCTCGGQVNEALLYLSVRLC